MRALLAVALVLPFAAEAQASLSPSTITGAAACSERVASYTLAEPVPSAEAFHLQIDRPAGGAVRVFGATHSDDPADPQFAAIATAYRDLRPTVVFYEGPARPTETTADATIRAYGESGYLRWLAAQDSVPAARLEPDPSSDYRAVAEALDSERAALFFVLRETARLRDRKGVVGDSLRQTVAALLVRAAPLGLPLATLDELGAAYGRHFTAPAAWTDAPATWFDPLADDAETGGVFMAAANRASSEARNRHMARVLGDAVRDGGRVFAVVGRDHVPRLAPALRCAAE